MRCVAALAVLLLAAPASALGGETVHSDDWYALYVNGTKAGHAHTIVLRVTPDAAAGSDTPDAPGDTPGASPGDTAADDAPPAAWITITDTFLKLSRRSTEIELRLGSRVEEDAEGRVTRFRQTQRMSDVDVVTEGRLDGDMIRLDQNGIPGELRYPEGALGPAAIDRRVAAAGFTAGTTTSVLGFATDSPGRAGELTFTVRGAEPIQVIDRRLRLHLVETTNSLSAARGTQMWMDGTARMHVSESEVPGVGTLRMVRTTEALARSVSSPAEVFAAALIVPDRGIAGPRRARRGVFRLARRGGEPFDADVYAGEGQTVGERRADGSRDVTVEAVALPRELAAFTRPVRDPELAPFLARSAYLEIDDPRVRALAAEAVGDERDAVACARRIERFVRRYVADKTLGVGFATAAEVARTAEGDCTEHAMLAAALARAAGLPSRVVMGIVYVPGMSAEGVGPKGAFGYHMWTEILIAKDRWLAIDAALGGFDATHIAMAKSDLSATSPVSQMILPLLEVIASVEIAVIDVETALEGE